MIIRQLELINLCQNYAGPFPLHGHSFTMTTCQRKILICFNRTYQDYFKSLNIDVVDVYSGLKAYQFLLEILCGLKSRMLAENEIVTQFKEAFQEYLHSSRKNNYIIYILEKAFQDSKEIRTHYLKEIGQLSYAGIAKKLLSHYPTKQILILGSGKLAIDMIKIFHKRKKIILCARNQMAISSIEEKYQVSLLPWAKRANLSPFSFIINTIGSSTSLLSTECLERWSRIHGNDKLLIDLSSPSSFKEQKNISDKIITLENVLLYAETLNVEKMHKVQKAKEAILELSKRRLSRDAFNFPYGWEELSFV